MEVLQESIAVIVDNDYRILEDKDKNILYSKGKNTATFKTNDWQIVPKFTNYVVDTTSVPKEYLDEINNVGNALQLQIDNTKARLDAVDTGKTTQLILIKNNQESLTAQFETFKAQTATSLAGIINDKISYAGLNKAINQSQNTMLSQINAEYPTFSYIGTNYYTKTDTDSAISSSQYLMESKLSDMDAKYNEAIAVVVNSDGSVKSQKIEELSATAKSIKQYLDATITNINQAIASTNSNVSSIKDTSIPALHNIIDNFKAGVKSGNSDYVWTNASQLLTTTYNNKILTTGYTILNGQYAGKTISSIGFMADSFYLQTSDGYSTPFSVVGNNILFNGKVNFSNVNGLENYAKADMSNVTVIDGGKISTNSITADKINTKGLIAERISATEINGININGAVIRGAVIKASYLDLDGQLEVLTNYHISIDQRNSNPDFYRDAVLVNKEYRIPSLSSITGSFIVTYKDNTTITQTLNIFSYDCANVGNNRKAVSLNPVCTFQNTLIFYVDSQFVLSDRVDVKIYIGSNYLFSIQMNDHIFTITNNFGNNVTLNISQNEGANDNINFVSGGITFNASILAYKQSRSGPMYYEYELKIVAGAYTLQNVNNSTQLIKIVRSNYDSTTGTSIFKTITENVVVNNMV